jgi:hypothetical protein
MLTRDNDEKLEDGEEKRDPELENTVGEGGYYPPDSAPSTVT